MRSRVRFAIGEHFAFRSAPYSCRGRENRGGRWKNWRGRDSAITDREAPKRSAPEDSGGMSACWTSKLGSRRVLEQGKWRALGALSWRQPRWISGVTLT